MINKIYLLLIAFALGHRTIAVAQTPPTDLRVTATNYVQYPSLSPVTAISMHIGDFGTHIYDIIQSKVDSTDWNCASPEFYKVVVVDSSLKALRQLRVTAVRLIGNDPKGVRYTHCEGNGHPAIVDLILGSQVNSGDLIQVFVYDDTAQTKLLISSDGKLSHHDEFLSRIYTYPPGSPRRGAQQWSITNRWTTQRFLLRQQSHSEKPCKSLRQEH